MKKSLLIVSLFLFALAGLVLAVPTQADAETSIAAGTVVKGEGLNALYYIGEDGKRYIFPNDKIYYSWFEDFANVQEISLEELYALPLGRNIRYKPGNLLIKIQTDPKVYAVGNNGKLHWIKSEALAKQLYGADWNFLIDDVADSFFTNYEVDEPIETEDDFDPEEEEDETPSISHNLGFKARLQVAIEENKEERRCNRLEDILKKTQKRLERFGIETTELGSDYISECFDNVEDTTSLRDRVKNRLKWFTQNKVTICHVNEDQERTLSVSKMAVPAHLAHGDYIGECGTISDDGDDSDDSDNDDADNTDDDGDDADDSGNDDAVIDETAPVISELETTVSSTSAAITWTTDEAASSMVSYSLENLETAASVTVLGKIEFVTSHSFELLDLATSTEYFFKIQVEDEAGNELESDEDSFTTLAE